MVRVYEVAKELSVPSRVVMAKLQEMGEFVRSASSPLQDHVVTRLLRELAPEASNLQASEGLPFDGSRAEFLRAVAESSRAKPRTAQGKEQQRNEILRIKSDILEAWARLGKLVPASERRTPNNWLASESGVEHFRVYFAANIRNWVAHPSEEHEPEAGTFRDALRVMHDLESRLSNRPER